MSQDILRELAVFIQSFISGIAVILAYDVLRITRRIIKHNTIVIAAEDLLYWVACAFFLFRVMFQINDGMIRWYSVIGITTGMLLYNFTLSTLLVAGISKGINRVLKLFYKFLAIVSRPFRWIIRKIVGFFKVLFKKLKKFTRFIKKRLKKIYKEVKILLCKH